jgi:asparagine synthase (glutamine-hydrolysing)
MAPVGGQTEGSGNVCGIFGYVLSGPSDAPRPSLDAAVRSLRHRGPDGDGVFEDIQGESVCGLAHTRLAIIDLSPGGHQPMHSEDGRYTITFNGEIYNYESVRRELQAAGDPARGESDTAVILGAYARWGVGALDHLRGMFAFAIWDRLERKLFVARDRLGVKPLYLARVPRGLLFSSEVRTLLGTEQVERVIDRHALVDYLAFGSVREPRTLVKGISMLPAGTFAEYHDGELRERRYWAPPLRIDRTVSFRDAVEETRHLLLDSITLRLVSDVPVGIFLSGGMDSGATVALATQVARSPIHTFTVTFDEATYDESSFASDIARRFGAEHHVLPLAAKTALDHLDDALAALDQPSADGTNTYFVAKATREAGLAVALSGIGGDEILAGYPGFRSFPRLLAAAPALKHLPALGPRWPPGRFMLPARMRKGAAVLATQGNPFSIYALIRGMFSRAERAALMGGDMGVVPPAELDEDVVDWLKGGGGDAVEAYGTFELTNYLRNTLLRDSDVLGMAHALEIREPFLDERLIERTMTLPGRMKLGSGVNKPLLAQAVPELPQATSRRPKMGFTLPLEAWLRGPLRGWAKEILFGGHSSTRAPLDALAVRDAWRGFEHGRVSYSRIWTLIALERWCLEHRMSS